MFARIRKAVVAGVGAGWLAALATLKASGSLDRESIAQAVGAGAVALVLVGWATWRTPNAQA
jgi:hypothetical protein